MNCIRYFKTLGALNLKSLNPCKEFLNQHAGIPFAPCQVIQTKQYYMRRKNRTPYTKPLVFDSGDLDDHVVKVESSEPRPGYEQDFETYDETIKKIVSLEFSPKSLTMERMLEDVVKEIQDHPLDVQSLEIDIAKSTVLIRDQIKYCMKFRHDKYSIGSLRKRIEMRKENLGKLLVADEEKFYWLTKKLKLEYRMPYKYDKYSPLTVRAERKKVARDAALALVKQKNVALEKKLASERARFEIYKVQELEKIELELKELGIKKMENLSDTLKALGKSDLIPRRMRIPTASELIWKKKLEHLMVEKEKMDDVIYLNHNFLSPKQMPSMPSSYFF